MKKLLFLIAPLSFLFNTSIFSQPAVFSQPPSKISLAPPKENEKKPAETKDQAKEAKEAKEAKGAKEAKEAKENKEGIVFFTPPEKWMMADPNNLPSRVRVMVIGKGPTNFPPSINLSWEPFSGTLKDYLKMVKNLNASQGYPWKDLGTIQTQAGTGSLSQVDTKTQWGEIRLMHVILKKNGNIYILTTSALKEEFSLFYKDFFAAMRSLKIAKDEYEMVSNSLQRSQLKTAADKLKSQWQTLLAKSQKENSVIGEEKFQEKVFNSPEFQVSLWKPFQEMLNQKYNQYGPEWQSLFLQKLEDQLFN